MPQPVKVCAEAPAVEIVAAVKSACVKTTVLAAEAGVNYSRARELLSRYGYGLPSPNQSADHDVLVKVARAANVLLDRNDDCPCSRCALRRGS